VFAFLFASKMHLACTQRPQNAQGARTHARARTRACARTHIHARARTLAHTRCTRSRETGLYAHFVSGIALAVARFLLTYVDFAVNFARLDLPVVEGTRQNWDAGHSSFMAM
jgi:hypothetical protein